VSDQFGQDVAEKLRIEDAGRLGDRTERGVSDGETLLDRLEVADLTESAMTAGQGLEEGEEDQSEEVIVVELAVFGLVAGTALVVRVGEKGANALHGIEGLSGGVQVGRRCGIGGHTQR